jgi:hypothetical protein
MIATTGGEPDMRGCRLVTEPTSKDASKSLADRTFAQLLIDCEEDRVRAVLVGMLRDERS